ncbi:MAG TPA: hypothetical protein VNM90_28745 [Haliangium sp.]|nr:hypothetical protein [Haliangium sp.]
MAELAAALAPHAGTASQANRSSERAARILALAGSPRSADGELTESLLPATVQGRRRKTGGEPSTVTQTLATVTQSPPTVTTFDIASVGGMTSVDASAEAAAQAARRSKRYLLIASVAVAAGLILGLLIARGPGATQRSAHASEGAGEPARHGGYQVAAPAVVSGLPDGDDRRADTDHEPMLPRPDAGAATSAPPTPSASPAPKGSSARRGDVPRSRAGSKKSNRVRQKLQSDTALNEDVYDDFD